MSNQSESKATGANGGGEDETNKRKVTQPSHLKDYEVDLPNLGRNSEKKEEKEDDKFSTASSNTTAVRRKYLLEKLKAEEEAERKRSDLFKKKLELERLQLEEEQKEIERQALIEQLKIEDSFVNEFGEDFEQTILEVKSSAAQQDNDNTVLTTERVLQPVLNASNENERKNYFLSLPNVSNRFEHFRHRESEQQRRMTENHHSQSHSNFNKYEERRNHSDLPAFSGDPEEWPLFLIEFEQSTEQCEYTEIENLRRLRKCLKGKALDAVQNILYLPDQLLVIMQILQIKFGRPKDIIHSLIDKVFHFPSPHTEKWDTLIDFALAVRKLVTSMKSLKEIGHLNNPDLLSQLVEKVPAVWRINWADQIERLRGEPDLFDFGDWIFNAALKASHIAPALKEKQKEKVKEKSNEKPARAKGHSVFATSEQTSSPVSPTKEYEKKTPRCYCCKEEPHHLSKCKKFIAMKIEDRWNLIKKIKNCFSCLNFGHQTFSCRGKKKCKEVGCESDHHPFLHLKKENIPSSSQNQTPLPPPSNSFETVSHTTSQKDDRILMKILPVTLTGPKGNKEVYALLDEASTVTLLKEEVADELGLEGNITQLKLKWTNDSSQLASSRSSSVKIKGYDCPETYDLKIRTIKDLDLPIQTLDKDEAVKANPAIKNLNLLFYKNVKPSLLIGLDNGSLIISREVLGRRKCKTLVSRTLLGHVISGSIQRKGNRIDIEQTFHISQEEAQLDLLHRMIKNSFSTEDFGTKPGRKEDSVSADERRAISIMDKTAKLVGKRWEVGLLWKEEQPTLPNSYHIALRHLHAMEKKMDRSSEFAEKYSNKIEEYLDKGYARPLNEEETNDKNLLKFYLPHFGVINPNKPKLRFVFNAASKSNGISLNDKLLKGPDLMTSLTGTMFTFRQKEIAFSGDIKEMFHQVSIRKADQYAQRFLWRGADRQLPPKEYLMRAMIFGSICSPYAAQEIKNRNAKRFVKEYPEAVEAIIKRHYVDDYLDSCGTEEEAIQLIKNVIFIQKEGGFELQKWVSNSETVLQSIPKELRAEEKLFIETNDPEIVSERVLGLKWNSKEDTLAFSTNFSRIKKEILLCQQPPTKREVLKLLMSLYDPLGFIINFTIVGRIIIQEIWRTKIGWDDEIPVNLFQQWKKWVKNLEQLKNFSIPRPYSINMRKAINLQLHVFSDASQEAFAAAAYIRVKHPGGVEVKLIASRARVTPLKGLTIPRAELQGAVLAARIAKVVKEQHSLKFDSTTFWSDSQTVLKWIRSDERRHPTFILHRVGEILETTEVGEWRWVPTKENVADEATRSDRIPELKSDSRWIIGPDYLLQEEEFWPKEKEKLNMGNEEEEEENVYFHRDPQPPLINLDRFSSFKKYLRIHAYVNRFLKNCQRKPEERFKGEFSVEEIKKAEWIIWRQIQEECFPNELPKIFLGKKLPLSSPLHNLPLMTCLNSLVRIRGRISKSEDLDMEAKQPIILHAKHRLVQLLMKKQHEEDQHQGKEMTLNNLRGRFWIIKARPTLKKIVDSCLVCRILRVKPSPPEMGDLPVCRLTSRVRPFTITGVDLFGPLEVTIGRSRVKRYGVLFTCLTTRAIHLELADNLTTDSAINAIRRMTARRGVPKQMWSDNGTNLRGADEELRKSIAALNLQLQENMQIKGIDWHFIPPASPHFGGSWERLVRSVKEALKITLKCQAPREETLRTLLAEAENIVNNRPLTKVSEDPKDEEALTPNHFLKNSDAEEIYLPGIFTPTDLLLKKQWRIAQMYTEHFWKRWLKEYLPSLNQRNKWHKTTEQLNVGDLVLILDENNPRNNWPKGLIIKCYPGEDGQVRVVDIKTATGTYRRPAAKICLLDRIGFWTTDSAPKPGGRNVTKINPPFKISNKNSVLGESEKSEEKKSSDTLEAERDTSENTCASDLN